MKTKNGVNISVTNSKLGARIPSVNLPAGATCRSDAPCRKKGLCYALSGNYLFKSVQESLQNNLNLFLKDKKIFFNDIIDFLNNDDITFKFFRWFSSGDIVNMDFFRGIVKVAKKCKNTNFLLFTKKFNIVNDYLNEGKKIPKNLNVIFSGWDENFKIDNPYNLPTTYVYFNNQSNKHIPEYAIPCEGSCEHCKACWSLKKGQSVYFHKH